MTALALLTFVAVWMAPSSRSLIGNSRRDGARASTRAKRARSWVHVPLLRGFVCVLSCSGLVLVIGDWWLVPVGAAAGLAVSWWAGRAVPEHVVQTRREVDRLMPLTVDLLGACAQAGQPLTTSVQAVARAVGGPIAAQLDRLAAGTRLGAEPAAEWRRLGGDPSWAALSRAVARSVESGAPLADGLSRLAADLRARQRLESQRKARSVGVRAAAPLAACFLPAFMLIGVVPTVAGAFSRLLA